MGCDIHISIQRQETFGAWHEVRWQQEPYALIGQKAVPDLTIAPECFRNRNYDLFAILANVRNGRGFAGIKTGDGWPSIAPDRGWPEWFNGDKVSPNPHYPEEGPAYMGDHSFTWVGLNELKAFPWDETVTKLYGVVKAEVFEQLTATGDTPDSYSVDITGPGIVVYTPEDYLAAKQAGKLAKKPYVRMSWDETARSATYDWPGKVIPWLDTLAEGKPLRLILGFDS